MPNFAMTGVAGYIAPRHIRAIKETGNTLVAATDPHDSVGILDSYFPDVSYFREYERFDRHLEKLRRGPEEHRVNYLSICSPNHLHDAHIRLALRSGADAICEKPIVLNPWNLDALAELEVESGRRVWTVLQLRVHPALLAFKEQLDLVKDKGLREKGVNATEYMDSVKAASYTQEAGEADPLISHHLPFTATSPTHTHRYQVELSYITTRGLWYDYSWKGDSEKSGGIATNIGVHFFDLLLWWFGYVQQSIVTLSDPRRMAGELELADADVRWKLSLEREDLPEECQTGGRSTYRSIKVDGKEVEFTGGFTDLHTEVYKRITAGEGFGIADAYPSIQLVHNLRK